MTHRETFKFGKLGLRGSNAPSITQLDSRIAQSNFSSRISSSAGEREGARNIEVTNNYYYFTYVTEMQDQITVLDNQNNDQPDTIVPRRTSRVIYFGSGKYAYESNEDILDSWIPEFLVGSNLNSNQWKKYDDLSSSEMRSFYANSNDLRNIKYENIGENPPNSNWPSGTIETHISELSKEADSVVISTGHFDNDLNQARIIDRFSDCSDIAAVSATDSNGDSVRLKNSGVLSFSWQEGLSPAQEALAIERNVNRILPNLP